MIKLICNIASGFLGFWLSVILVPEVILNFEKSSNFFGFIIDNNWKLFLVLGIVLGLINYFIKPIINIIALPLKIITFGLFGVIINMAIIWFLDIMFVEIIIPLWLPLFLTSLIISIINLILQKILIKE